MQQRFKGFTLVEMLVTVALLVIVATVAVPSFSTLVAKNRADTETGDFYRALNYARLEAVNRGVSVRLTPETTGNWAGIINVTVPSVTTAAGTLRVVPAMSASSTMVAANSAAYIEFNNLGSLVNPTETLLFTYTNGSISRHLVVCVNGRVVLNNGTTCS
ncbi:GspH/FimT family pseudopilin [Pseudomonas typographi]|uniref:Type II secretion system protein H n=1 Tax=Pseudomonas typographi TaxID=2715964 RepID=A0ABR7YXS2_9PSED|nr:GspH/FimT family pseudopilin [Pseudomonas typographi]MBD1551063.1 prepilin-type N-terminal cleavage/methylation domain-containing protein [Pseudomonas typographi]MBD1587976.1 prepilin-type N-terminal cleavage/methylation domain-containing protein [Pseudomonas typographi]MBD1597965.1 prepilin-type N-terminal cleavage/methylation domain-containing protein [Pseudomonas typographi]